MAIQPLLKKLNCTDNRLQVDELLSVDPAQAGICRSEVQKCRSTRYIGDSQSVRRELLRILNSEGFPSQMYSRKPLNRNHKEWDGLGEQWLWVLAYV